MSKSSESFKHFKSQREIRELKKLRQQQSVNVEKFSHLDQRGVSPEDLSCVDINDKIIHLPDSCAYKTYS
jgi:hypothetical protein